MLCLNSITRGQRTRGPRSCQRGQKVPLEKAMVSFVQWCWVFEQLKCGSCHLVVLVHGCDFPPHDFFDLDDVLSRNPFLEVFEVLQTDLLASCQQLRMRPLKIRDAK